MKSPAPATERSTDGREPGYVDVSHFSSPDEEYAALRGAAALVDRSARLRMTFSGAKAAEALTGLVTNDVVSLKPGGGLYAAALTAKGKIIADVRIFARAEDLMVDAPRNAAEGFTAMVRKFVNPRLARYTDVTVSVRSIGAFGPKAKSVISAAFSVESEKLERLLPYQHLQVEVDGASAYLAAVPDLGVPGFEFFLPVEIAGRVWSRLAGAGALPAGTTACEIARIEAGRPLWGVDIDESTLAQEANLDALDGISYTKGCYTGQETVARVHFRGHVNRSLRGVRSTRIFPLGAQLFDHESHLCGDVRSSVESPRIGPIAIVMLKRGVEAGAEVLARWPDGESRAHVSDLPFD